MASILPELRPRAAKARGVAPYVEADAPVSRRYKAHVLVAPNGGVLGVWRNLGDLLEALSLESADPITVYTPRGAYLVTVVPALTLGETPNE